MELSASSPTMRRTLAAAAFWVGGAIVSLTSASGLLALPAASYPPQYLSICQDLTAGRANEATSLLQKRISENSADATAHNLLCRVYVQEQRWTDAEKECEQAVQLQPDNSDYHQWLGRAYGGAAAHTSIGSAYVLARKVRAEFETAVRLNPTNLSALSDLGEYDVDVPRLVGGGLGHAEQVAKQLEPLDPVRWRELQAKIAYKKSDFSAAEMEWKQAIQASSQPAEQWMELAGFYAKRKNFSAMRQAIKSGVTADPEGGSALVMGASLLIENRQDLPQAKQMLQKYLASPQQSEDMPAFQVQVQLGNLLASQGDAMGAHRELAAALALASNYGPALQATRE